MINRNKKGVANRIAITFLSVSTALFLSGASLAVPLVANAALSESQIQAILTLLQSFGADTATVNNVNASLRGQPATTPVPSTGGGGNCGFTRSLTVGSTGNDVKCLQQFLNAQANLIPGARVASSGAGSPGSETSYFGQLTRSAVGKWQAAVGVAPAVGYFGPISQAKYNSVIAGGGPTPTPPGPTPIPGVGTGLQVMAGVQPVNYIAPGGAARVPFTVIKLTASADGDVSVNGVTVERTGPAADGAFVGVVLLDENMVQMGISKTLNSNHQAVVGGMFTVKAGQTRTLTVAANMDTLANLADDAGNVAMFSVNGINTSATVSGSLPITGAAHTINAALTIGSVTMARGALDPGAAQTKEVGTTGYTFSSVKVTAGSTEKVWLTHIIWNQIGSAGSGDLANVKTYVNGTAYDTVVSADGKYYTAKFPGSGILMDKGFSVDVSIKGDIVGGSSRTVAFDVAKMTDIGLMGDNFKFGISPPQTNSCAATTGISCFTSTEDPWYDGSTVTVSTGTINVSVASTVSAQNIAVNTLGQPLGALVVDVRGEQISVSRVPFNVTLGSEGASADIDDITNAQLVDETGAVLSTADGTAADSSNTTSSGDGSIVFNDTITFPIGQHTYKVLGKIGTDIGTNVTVTASTTPTDWGTVKGLTTGNTITPAPSSALTLPQMTVKAGGLTVSVQTVPAAQTVIAGSNQFEFARYSFDGTASGEDIRVTSIPLAYGVATGNANDLTGCKLYDGINVVNSSTIIDPSSESSSTSFTFDGSGLIVPKGTSKTINLKCNLRQGSTGSYLWGLDDAQATNYTGATGVTSGQTITETLTDSNGQAMTAASGGSLAVTLDSSSPSYKPVAAGMTNVELARIRFDASNEDIDLRQVALQIEPTGSTSQVTAFASSSVNDLVNKTVTLWTTDGVQVGSAQFNGTGVFGAAYATSSPISGFSITKDDNKILVVKGNIVASICNSCDINHSGDFLKINYDGANTGINGTYGVGLGGNITPTGADTASEGVRIFKAYPTFAAVSGWQPSSLANGDQPLMRFSVKANNGNVGVYKFTIRMATTSPAVVSSINVFGYNDSAFSNPVAGVNTPSGQLNGTNGVWVDASTDINFIVQDSTPTNKVLTIPSGSTYYFEVRGTVSGATTGAQVSTQLQGDATSFSAAGAQMDQAATVDSFVDDDFIWTPHSTTTAGIANNDFSNGYLLPGLPTSNMNAQVLSK